MLNHSHTVIFYQEDSHLLDQLSQYFGAALLRGESAILIISREHRDDLLARLKTGGVDTETISGHGRFQCLDAEETLARIMVDGQPDADCFRDVLGGAVEALSRSAAGRRLHAFGEMVAVLCAQGRRDAAIRLEQLWNRLSATHSFQLHCAYPMSLFLQAGDARGLEKICKEHSHVIPAERYTTLRSDEERLNEVALLQQRAQALETEILECSKLQRALEEREAELRDFVENALIPMHWVAEDGKIVWANAAELALLGYERDEYIGHDVREFYPESNAIEDILQRLERREELKGYRAKLRCKNGATRIVRIYSNAAWQGSKFAHTRCFTFDVTDLERSERRTAAQLAVTRLLADSSSLAEITHPILKAICGVSECAVGAIWEVDDERNTIRCVSSWHSRDHEFPNFESVTIDTSFAPGAGLPGRVWQTGEPCWISNLKFDENFPRRAAALKDGLQSAFAFPISLRQKVTGVIEFLATEVREPDAEFLTMMTSIGMQIGQFSERVQADDSRNKLAAIVESSDDAIVSKDLGGVVTSWNKAAERIFGYTAAEMIGRPITTIIPPELQDDEPKILAKIQAGERIEHFQTVRLTKSGERIDVSLIISPVKDRNGKIIGAAKIARDITEQKRLEAALHTSERLASVGRLAATVAHEINNPLEAVTNYIYLAKQRQDLPEKVKGYLTAADRELGRVAHIAQQTLGFYRDNSQPTIVSVSEALNDVLTVYDRKLAYKQLRMTLELDPDLSVYTLQGEFKQMLSNLIANAIDASSERGRIVIRARRTRHPRSGEPGMKLTIADTGVGVPEHDKGRIFSPFFTTKRDVGTGLGLWITRDMVTKKGGHIRFRSRTSKPSGTVMSIFLPSVASASGDQAA
ncbi:MAG: PAS domain S-box protein [Acidobacteriaceae bacterium]